jgi:hypothetical protein
MDQRDLDLLDKQMRRFDPSPRREGVMMLAVVAVFFAGLICGSYLSGDESESVRVAATDATSAAFPNVAPPQTTRPQTTRQ